MRAVLEEISGSAVLLSADLLSSSLVLPASCPSLCLLVCSLSAEVLAKMKGLVISVWMGGRGEGMAL